MRCSQGGVSWPDHLVFYSPACRSSGTSTCTPGHVAAASTFARSESRTALFTSSSKASDKPATSDRLHQVGRARRYGTPGVVKHLLQCSTTHRLSLDRCVGHLTYRDNSWPDDALGGAPGGCEIALVNRRGPYDSRDLLLRVPDLLEDLEGQVRHRHRGVHTPAASLPRVLSPTAPVCRRWGRRPATASGRRRMSA